MGKCASNCEYLKLYDDELESHVTVETGGYCVKHSNKMVYFDDECPDYKPKDKDQGG